MTEELDCFKKAYPQMNFIEVMPKLVGDPSLASCQVSAPTKSNYLGAVAKAI